MFLNKNTLLCSIQMLRKRKTVQCSNVMYRLTSTSMLPKPFELFSSTEKLIRLGPSIRISTSNKGHVERKLSETLLRSTRRPPLFERDSLLLIVVSAMQNSVVKLKEYLYMYYWKINSIWNKLRYVFYFTLRLIKLNHRTTIDCTKCNSKRTCSDIFSLGLDLNTNI